MRDNLERGVHFHMSNSGLVPTAIAEVSTKEAFVDVLENYVIKPLGTLKVSISFGQVSLF